jgi:GAF domain-containing protein
MDTQVVILVVDLAAETRWGAYRGHAIDQGVRSSLSVPISGGDDAAGALNLYSGSARSFGRAELRRAQRFADQATGALHLATRLADQTELNQNLRAAMATRSIIDQAIGVVMAQNRCDTDTAFALLRQASQNRNIKLWGVATDIVTAVGGVPAKPSPPVS